MAEDGAGEGPVDVLDDVEPEGLGVGEAEAVREVEALGEGCGKAMTVGPAGVAVMTMGAGAGGLGACESLTVVELFAGSETATMYACLPEPAVKTTTGVEPSGSLTI